MSKKQIRARANRDQKTSSKASSRATAPAKRRQPIGISVAAFGIAAFAITAGVAFCAKSFQAERPAQRAQIATNPAPSSQSPGWVYVKPGASVPSKADKGQGPPAAPPRSDRVPVIAADPVPGNGMRMTLPPEDFPTSVASTPPDGRLRINCDTHNEPGHVHTDAPERQN